MSCQICLSNITKYNTNILCYECKSYNCKNCLKKWLSEKNKVCCLHCNKEWNMEYIYNIGKSFLNYYTTIQKKNVLNLEKSYIPKTQEFLLLENEYFENKDKYMYYYDLYFKCKKVNYKTLKLKYESLDIFKNEKFTKQKLLSYLDKKRISYLLKYKIYYNAYILGNVEYLDKIKNSNSLEIKNISECPLNTCKGYILSDTFTCGICKIKICKECFEILKDDHKCNKDIVNSIKVIEKETKPCPTCSSKIKKIDGCYAKDTVIPLFDGTFKYAYQIKEGDILIGDDFTPRKVLKTFQGNDLLYKINQHNGISYTVNSKHSLALYTKGYFFTLTVDQYNLFDNHNKKYIYTYRSLNNHFMTNTFTVEYVGKGEYYGWYIDKNNQFLLSDLSVVRNCDQMYCTQCNTAFSWRTGEIEKGRIHNPHYYEKLRNQGLNIENNEENFCDEYINNELLDNMYEYVYQTFIGQPIYEYTLLLLKEIYKKYMINSNIVNIYTNMNYNFQTNYIDRLLYMKNAISEKVFIKKIYNKYKNINHINDIIYETIKFNFISKIILLNIIKIFLTINENNEVEVEKIEKNLDNIHNHIYLIKNLSTDFKEKIKNINKCYNKNIYI